MKIYLSSLIKPQTLLDDSLTIEAVLFCFVLFFVTFPLKAKKKVSKVIELNFAQKVSFRN